MSHKNKFFLFFLFIFTLILLIPSLDVSIRRSDEGIYANVTHEMLEKHEPFAPTYFYQPYYNKLPLRFWISYAFNSVIGEHNFSYRIPEILFALAIIFLIVLYGKRFFNKYSVGILAGFLFITSEEYLDIAKQFTTNNLTLLLNVGVIGLLWSWYNKYKENSNSSLSTIFLISILSGLTFFTRTVYAFIPALLFFSFLLIKLDLWLFIKKEWRRIIFLTIIFLSTILFLFLPLLSHYNLKDLINIIFIAEVYERATEGFHNTTNYLYYIKLLFSPHYSITPILLVASLIFGIYKSLKKNDNHLFLLLWAIIPIIVFSLAKSRLPWYILISFPAFTLIVASFIVYIYSQILISKGILGKIFFFLLFACCCILSFLQILYPISHIRIEKKSAINYLVSNINNYGEDYVNSSLLAIEAGIKDQYPSNKSSRYYINLIKNEPVYLTTDEIIKAIGNNSYEFYLTSFEVFEKIYKRYQPKGVFLNIARRTFFPMTAIFSFNHGGDFAPLMDNYYRQLDFSLQNDGSYIITTPFSQENNIILTMTFDNHCKNENKYFLNIRNTAQKLQFRYFKNRKAYIAIKINDPDYYKKIVIKPENSCLKLINASEGIDIDKILSIKPYNQAVNSAYTYAIQLKLPNFLKINSSDLSE